MTLYGYGARRIRNSSFGLFSIARTTRLIVRVHDSQREMLARKNVREMVKTTSAPKREAQYDMIAPVHGPKV